LLEVSETWGRERARWTAGGSIEWRQVLRAVALNDLELKVDDAAAKVFRAIHDAAQEHLSGPFSDIVARKPDRRDRRRNMAKKFYVVVTCYRDPAGNGPSPLLAFEQGANGENIASAKQRIDFRHGLNNARDRFGARG
jgi:hypothetical protein